jgi:gas vesicle protein
MRGKRILGSFILGALAGMLISIFSSPYSGKDVRKKIKAKTKKLINK